jgi:hypothetical protein
VNPLSRNEKELILDRCFGLTGAEQVVPVKTLLAHNEQASDLHARIPAALGPPESLLPERCPAELAARTVRRLYVTAQEAQAAGRSKTTRLRLHYREDFWLCLSSNVLMKSS